jgi:hypothetical protein
MAIIIAIMLASTLRYVRLALELSQGKNMPVRINDYEADFVPDKMEQECEIISAEETPIVPEQAGTALNAAPLPWIGALRNPHLGPMVVVDESGYLVPLYTAGNLLRGFRSWWRTSHE